MSGDIKQLPVIIISQIGWCNHKAKGAGCITGEFIPVRIDIRIQSAVIATLGGQRFTATGRNRSLGKHIGSTNGKCGGWVLP
jgi:hypothetical protein